MLRKTKAGKRLPVRVSQNYLTSHKIISRLLGLTSIGKDDHVVEIGPGKGHTTACLLNRCKRVLAVEIDPKLCAMLRSKLGSYQNLRLYHQDFLTWPLPKGAYKVFSNIPFFATTGIMRKLTGARTPPSEAWLTMEKGAAKRFMGKPYESPDSLLIKTAFDMRIVYHFRREDFHPMPRVEVVLVHLKKKAQPDIRPDQQSAYKQFIKKGFSEYGFACLFTKKQLSRAMQASGIANGTPSAQMRYVQWLCLFRCYWQHVLGR